jgi:hypothetical protein
MGISSFEISKVGGDNFCRATASVIYFSTVQEIVLLIVISGSISSS